MSQTAYTVLVADDHQLFREGLVALISRWGDFRVVGTACDGIEAVDQAARMRPDLVLMDVRMPVMGGIEATAAITAANPCTCVVMLTISNQGDDVVQALRSGAHGYLSKDEPINQIHDFLIGAVRGETALSAPIAAKVLRELAGPSPTPDAAPPASERLTARERDVLQLLVEGLSNEEIGAKMHLSEATVKKHLRHVMSKWHMKNRVQVAVRGLRQGLVE